MVGDRGCIRLLAGIAWLFVLQPIAGFSRDFPPSFEDAEQDGKGVVWAISRSERNLVFAYDGRDWRSIAMTFPSKTEAMPVRLAKTSDGFVMAVWKLGEERIGVTRHQDQQSGVVAECLGFIAGTGLEAKPFVDSSKRFWFASDKPEIYCVSEKEEDSFRFEVKEEHFLSSKRKKWDGFNKVRMTEDERGRVWVWTNGAAAASNYASIRGALIFNGNGEPQQIEGFEGIKSRLFSEIVQKAPGEMWLGVPCEGLFILNTETGKASLVKEPVKGAFQRIQEIFQMGDDWYLVGRWPGQKNSLWRLGDGKWDLVLDRLDVHAHGMERQLPRRWVQSGDCYLLHASGHGPWVIPKEGKPVLLDWRSGFPVEASSGLFPFSDGKFMAIGYYGKIASVSITLPPVLKAHPRITEVPIRWGWEIGVNQHLWAFFEDAEPLMEWDGTQWHQHAMPEGMAQRSSTGVACDRQGRVWVMPNGNKKAGFFDSKKKQWETFESWEVVFESLQKRNSLPTWVGNSAGDYMVNVSVDGKQMAFKKGWSIAYFDGVRWKEWKRDEIAPGRGSIGGAPFFDDQDRLSLNVGEECWYLDGCEGWVQGKYDDRYAELYGFKSREAPPPLPGVDVATRWAVVYDNHGVAWVAAKGGGLVKVVGQDRVVVFSAKAHSPFLVPRIFGRAWVDPRGNLFLRTASNAENTWMIAAGAPLPKTTLKVRRLGTDGAELSMEVQTPGNVQVYWRLNDEPWQSTSESRLVLDAIPAGNHRFMAYAVDEEFQKEAVPVTASLKITGDPKQQIRRLVRRLGDPDYNERRAAVAGLALHRKAALPALKAALEKASGDLRWWIEAAIQQIEREEARRAKENGAPAEAGAP